jgi:hypothetical protein
MDLLALAQLPIRYKLWKPLHLKLILKDLLNAGGQPVLDHASHLSAAIDWLCHAQDNRAQFSDHGGVSAGWSFEDGWLPSYPETSGYIVETFLAAQNTLAQPQLRERASRILDWELSLQNSDGAYPGHFGEAGSQPVIFNTGQIIHGMIAGHYQLDRPECLESAVRAGQWMLTCQDDDGCWRRNVHNDIPHTYNSRAAWGLLRAGLAANDSALINGATKNFDWVLTQRQQNGWFANNAFTTDAEPFTHTIAYAARGMLEAGILLDNTSYTDAALKIARQLADKQQTNGYLAGTFDANWQSSAYYCCLTGLAQTSIIWSRLRQAGISDEFTDPIAAALNYLKSQHNTSHNNPLIRGAIAGSAPIWGRYSMFEFPNWAAKFFADALLVEMNDSPVPALQPLPISHHNTNSTSVDNISGSKE